MEQPFHPISDKSFYWVRASREQALDSQKQRFADYICGAGFIISVEIADGLICPRFDLSLLFIGCCCRGF